MTMNVIAGNRIFPIARNRSILTEFNQLISVHELITLDMQLFTTVYRVLSLNELVPRS